MWREQLSHLTCTIVSRMGSRMYFVKNNCKAWFFKNCKIYKLCFIYCFFVGYLSTKRELSYLKLAKVTTGYGLLVLIWKCSTIDEYLKIKIRPVRVITIVRWILLISLALFKSSLLSEVLLDCAENTSNIWINFIISYHNARDATHRIPLEKNKFSAAASSIIRGGAYSYIRVHRS
jgi:hypothetical protein